MEPDGACRADGDVVQRTPPREEVEKKSKNAKIIQIFAVIYRITNPVMPPSAQITQPPTDSPPTRRELEFDPSKEGKIVIEVRQQPWDWQRIRQLFDEVLPLSTNRQTTDSKAPKEVVESLAKQLYPYLPKGKNELRTIRTNAKRFGEMAHRSRNLEARDALRPYVMGLAALSLAAGQKLAAIFCEANWRNWDLRAYRFFQELQLNLIKLRRIHFVTLTFTGDPTYQRVRDLLKDFTGNQLYRQGFESVEVVCFHPENDLPGRLHVHLLLWSKCQRSRQAETTAIEEILAATARAGRGIGFTDCRPVSGATEILKVSAYMALNYSRTLRIAKGPNNPIPKGAHVLSRPQNCLPGQAWAKVGKVTLITPATTAWRKAVSRYAAARGRSTTGDRRWIWPERRHIREYLEPEEWEECSVTGLDGYTYHIREPNEDRFGTEVYRLESEDGRSFYPTVETLEKLAALQILPNTLPKDNSLDFTTGTTANWLEMLGLDAVF